RQPLDGMALAVADGHAEALRQLGTTIRDYFRVGLAQYWQRISAAIHADLAARADLLSREGIGQLLASLHPDVRWHSPVLEIPFPLDRDTHLDGRGLLLVPSFFCWGQPITLQDPDLPQVFVYPIDHDLSWAQRRPAAPSSLQSLAALIGSTRLAVLTTIADGGCTTTRLAKRVGVSAASASEHAAVLRDAGMITTTRQGRCVIHSATPTATTFLTGRQSEDRPW
ncbi:MAG TPA: DUF5937 family protein, partial [Pseudonocardiaceae bacterium]|nr:DUF5937 family protein [Pseudonocardiaceae bacterium]